MNEPSVWKWARETFLRYWMYIAPLLLVSVFLAAAGFVVPILWQKLLDQALAGSMDKRLASTMLFLMLVESFPATYLLQERFINRYRFDSERRLFQHLLRLSIPYHRDRGSTKLTEEAEQGVQAGSRLLKLTLQGEILYQVPMAAASFVYIGFRAPKPVLIVSILAAFFAVFLVLNKFFGGRLAAVAAARQELNNEVKARQREAIQHIETVKLHRAEQQEATWHAQERHRARLRENQMDNYQSWFSTISNLAHVLPFMIALLLFLPHVANGTLTIGTLVALQFYCSRAVTPAGFIGNIYQEVMQSTAELKPALRILAQQPTVAEADRPIQMKPLRHQIELRDVSLRYPDAQQSALGNLSLAIKAGERVAIVGKSGSGKTTLARLLARLYDPDHGVITMDGIDLRQISFESLYKQVSYVTQEVSVFSGSIGENVSYGLGGHLDAQVTAACQQAAADFVFTRKQGLGTKIGELGEKLSGGERQRLALARVFLRNPTLLILDEATSSLDETTQRQVQQAFMTINGSTTIVVIAHRITTVKKADRIVVLDEGQIVDIGSHDQLLERCELYQELCREMAD